MQVPLRRLVGAHALEHAQAVVECVRQHVHLGVAPGHHLAIHPDQTIAIGETHHTTPVNSLDISCAQSFIRRCSGEQRRHAR